MRIGIDAACWHNRRGFGRFTRKLLEALIHSFPEREFVLFSDESLPSLSTAGNVEVVRVGQSRSVTSAAVARDSRSIRDILAFSTATARVSMDIMFFPAVYSWFPVIPRQPIVITLHDAIAEHFPELVMPHRRGRIFWGLKMRLARAQAQRFITVSEAARMEIVEHLGISSARIDVISEAPEEVFVPVGDQERLQSVRYRAGLSASDPYLIYVGGFAPHKNLVGFLRAFSEAIEDETRSSLHLVLVGDPEGSGFHSNTRELEFLIGESPILSERVHFTGYISDCDLAALYSDAIAGVMPSFSEGFGLPAVEAMACGTLVLASNAGSLPEVVGDAGLLFDPWSIQSMAQQIKRVACDSDLRHDLNRRALERATKFTWTKAARLTMRSLETAIEGR